MYRAKNTAAQTHPEKGSYWCLVRLLGTMCLNGGAMQHLSPSLVMLPPPFLPCYVPLSHIILGHALPQLTSCDRGRTRTGGGLLGHMVRSRREGLFQQRT